MTKRSTKAAVTLGILSVTSGVYASSSIAPGMAQLPPERPYNAVYQTLADPSSSVQTYIMSDGKGHTRSESTIAGQQYVSILDSTKKVCWSLNAQTKIATKVNFDTFAYYDPSYAKAQKPLGSRVVDGHPCHGWQMNSGGHSTQTWVGDDTGCAVLVTMDNKPYMRLVKHQPFVASPGLFTVPVDYKVVETPAFPTGASTSSGSSGSIYSGTGSIYGSRGGSSSSTPSSSSTGGTGSGGTSTNTESYDE